METEDEVIIVHKPYVLYALAGAIVLWVVAGIVPEDSPIKGIAGFVWLLVLVLIVWRFINMRQYRNEMSEAMTKGAVEMSGSIFSPARPLTVRISKALLSAYGPKK